MSQVDLLIFPSQTAVSSIFLVSENSKYILALTKVQNPESSLFLSLHVIHKQILLPLPSKNIPKWLHLTITTAITLGEATILSRLNYCDSFLLVLLPIPLDSFLPLPLIIYPNTSQTSLALDHSLQKHSATCWSFSVPGHQHHMVSALDCFFSQPWSSL